MTDKLVVLLDTSKLIFITIKIFDCNQNVTLIEIVYLKIGVVNIYLHCPKRLLPLNDCHGFFKGFKRKK